ncbi:MAG: mechanosensitive ion channel family protein [Verrucomicrobia bacterium]|nr:mechanosensitive ion channel family protein [Verrucomicrobiota bacterium]
MMEWLTDQWILHHLTISMIWVGVMYLFRFIIVHIIERRTRTRRREQKRWTTIGKRILLIIKLLGLAWIWSEQVYAFAFSLFAIAMAVVMAIKELLLCVHGAWIRVRGNAYEVGDRIEINGIRGDVVYINLLSTKILEVGPGDSSQQQTGRSISIPNSMLLQHPVVNESYLHHVLFHNIIVPLKRSDDWQQARDLLLEIAYAECAPYLEATKTKVRELQWEENVEFSSIDPRVTIHLPTPRQIRLTLRIPAPAHKKGKIEHRILDKFLNEFKTA